MSKVVLYEDEDFCVTGETIDEHIYVHVSAYKYSKAIKIKMASVWNDMCEEVWLSGWDRIFSYNTNEKFAKLFGGKLVDKDLRMYVWELK